MLSVRLPVNSGTLVAKFEEKQNLSTDIWLHKVSTPNLALFKDQLSKISLTQGTDPNDLQDRRYIFNIGSKQNFQLSLILLHGFSGLPVLHPESRMGWGCPDHRVLPGGSSTSLHQRCPLGWRRLLAATTTELSGRLSPFATPLRPTGKSTASVCFLGEPRSVLWAI